MEIFFMLSERWLHLLTTPKWKLLRPDELIFRKTIVQPDRRMLLFQVRRFGGILLTHAIKAFNGD